MVIPCGARSRAGATIWARAPIMTVVYQGQSFAWLKSFYRRLQCSLGVAAYPQMHSRQDSRWSRAFNCGDYVFLREIKRTGGTQGVRYISWRGPAAQLATVRRGHSCGQGVCPRRWLGLASGRQGQMKRGCKQCLQPRGCSEKMSLTTLFACGTN